MVSNFTEIETEEGKQVKIQYRMRITHSINRQFFESKITGYADRDIQKIGTLMTYARRYLYESILLIRGEPDLDGDGSLIAGDKAIDSNSNRCLFFHQLQFLQVDRCPHQLYPLF